MKEKNILITGGAGFIGSHLTQELLSQDNKVTVLDNLSTGQMNNVPKTAEFVKGDIRDAALIDALVEKSDIVFHLAEYIPSTQQYGSGHVIKFSVEDPIADLDISTRGTLTVLHSVKRHNKKIVFTSTAAVYGGSALPLKEIFTPAPMSPYGASKLCAEEYIKLYHRIYGTHASIVRFFNVYGPRQTKYLMYDFLFRLHNIRNPKTLEMLGTGKESRDFIYVKDAVNALLLVAETQSVEGEVFNIATGQPRTIREVIQRMIELQNLEIEVSFKGSSWKGDVTNLVADNSKLTKLGFQPKYSLSKGLKELIKWFQENTGNIEQSN